MSASREQKIKKQKELILLVDRIQKYNNEKDWEDLLVRIRPVVINICNKYDIYDIDNYLFYVTYRCVRVFKPEKGVAFTSYLSSALENTIKMEFKRSKKHIKPDTSLDLIYEGKSGDIHATVSDFIEDKTLIFENEVELRMIIQKVKNELKPKELIVFNLLLEERTQRDISNIIGIPLTSVNRYIKAIRQKIKSEL